MLRTLVLATCLVLAGIAHARDNELWNADPELKAWYSALMQPDNERTSCCGEADAYWCDNIHIVAGTFTYCTITDTRFVPGRTPVAVGTEILIPDRKLMDGRKTNGNPTGHGIVFLSSGADPTVYCYVQPAGI